MDPAFIDPPARIPWLLRLGMWVARKIAGKDLLPARLLAWYPKAATSSGILEALIAHHEGRVNERMLKLVRMAVSFTAGCPFCLDMNSVGWEKLLTREELAALQERIPLDAVATIGDMPNDVLMFQKSGVSIAMGNARPEVQQRARFVTTSNEEEGFANAIETFILGERGRVAEKAS